MTQTNSRLSSKYDSGNNYLNCPILKQGSTFIYSRHETVAALSPL